MSAGRGSDHEDEQSSAARVRLHPALLVQIVAGLLAAFAAFGLVRSAQNSLTTIAVATVFALALEPVVRLICRNWQWPRTRAVLLVVVGAIAAVTTVVLVMGPQAVRQARGVTADVPQTVRQFYDLPVVGRWLEQRDAVAWVDNAVKDLPSRINTQSLTRTVQGTVGGAVSTVLVLALTVAVMLDGPYLVDSCRRLMPRRWVTRADEIGRVLYVAIAQYFAGSLAVAALMGVVVLALCLIFRVPLAPIAALWAMITDLVPQVGGFLGGALLGLLALSQGPYVFVAVVGLYIVYLNLENHVISPAIVGRAVDITPATSMLAVLIGGAAAGVPGALVATPLVGAVKQLYLQLRWGQQPFDSVRRPQAREVRDALRRRRHR